MQITFELTTEQETRLLEILTERKVNDPSLTLDELCRRETVYALGLTTAQIIEWRKSTIIEKLATLDPKKIDDVATIVNNSQKEKPADLEENQAKDRE